MASIRPRPWSRLLVLIGGVVMALMLLAWWLWPLGAGPAPSGRATIATGVPTGVYVKYGELLKQDLAHDQPGLQVRLTNSQGSVENLQRVATGQADFAFATVDAVTAYLAQHPQDGGRLRACARLYDDFVQLVVPKNSKVGSVQDLRGLRVGIGESGSGVQLVARSLLRAAGLDSDHDITPTRAGIDTMPALLRAGRLDAFFWSGGLPTSAVQNLAGSYPIKLVQLGDLVEPLHRQGSFAQRYRTAALPPDLYPEIGSSESVNTVAIANLLITADHVSAELTQAVTRTVINGRDRIGQQVHAAQNVDLRTAIFTDPLPLHEGAQRYYRSVKP
ncbi:TAXI family TRAP transporter solute-binding subunit [Streptomyces sp. HUAS TT7]|uniref:TAXI family TRAP transporter solute-binding subunit n=1 Tax=Streptomyces sp. HUAS TT7 TaxID=3447507 RepID=UPI003F65EE16